MSGRHLELVDAPASNSLREAQSESGWYLIRVLADACWNLDQGIYNFAIPGHGNLNICDFRCVQRSVCGTIVPYFVR